MSNKITIYADDLDGGIWVSLWTPSFTYKYMLEVEKSVATILSLEDGVFGPARELLKKEFLENKNK